MINSRDIGELLPPMQARVRHFIELCRQRGIEILITSTYRDADSQSALYAQGRTVPGVVVTNAQAGQSWHNWRCAADFVPIVNGKAAWNDAALFERCGVLAEAAGLEWAGRWKRFKELAHVQYTGGLSLADLRAGKSII